MMACDVREEIALSNISSSILSCIKIMCDRIEEKRILEPDSQLHATISVSVI
jgi:hypothetical protein